MSVITPMNERAAFAGDHFGGVDVALITPSPGLHGLAVGVMPTSGCGGAVIAVTIQAGEIASWAALLTPGQAIGLAEHLLRHATNVTRIQIEAKP